jgi:hypothetical protein
VIRTAFFQIKQPSSQRAVLSGLVLGCVLPLAGMAAALLISAWHQQQQQLSDSTLSRARAMLAVVDQDFNTTQSALFALAGSRMLEQGDLAGFHARTHAMLPAMHADSVLLISRTGDILMSTRVPFGKALPRMGLTPLLSRTISTGKPGVSDLFIGPLTGSFLYTVAVPIKRDGVVVMSLNATAVPAGLNHVLAEQQLPPNWRVAIVDSGGHVVARNRDIDQYLGHLASGVMQERLASGPREGVVESVTLDGIAVQTFYSKSAVTGWAVIVGIPMDDMTAPLRQSLGWLALATLAVLTGGLAWVWRRR